MRRAGISLAAVIAAVTLSGGVAAASANTNDGPYDNDCQTTQTCAPSQNGNGNGKAKGRPAAGSVGKADTKNPKGQLPDADSDGNNGYECDGNSGIAKGNPAHSGCEPVDPGPI
ncbi:MAG: hypothetical protein MUE78_11975 [Ilumatobacteraceae bacterium]|jgi:hypothetical protein|nr:hypothetical protein [Ilumatobacteraceae bacterium]